MNKILIPALTSVLSFVFSSSETVLCELQRMACNGMISLWGWVLDYILKFLLSGLSIMLM